MNVKRAPSSRFRRTALLGAVLSGFIGVTALPAAADRTDGWFFDDIFGSGQQQAEQPKRSKEETAREEQKLLDQLMARSVFASGETERGLAVAMDRYQQLAQAGGWPQVPTGKTLRVGDTDEAVAAVGARLEVTEGLKPNEGSAWDFDEYVEAAVKRFQRRHGIPPNGVVDRRTVVQMNVPVRARLEQLRINIVRIRELLASGLPARYVLVNVPAMELQAIQDGQIGLASRVIVGRPERKTPTVHAKIKGLNFFPYWNVPDSVAFGDLIPSSSRTPAICNASASACRRITARPARSSIRRSSTGGARRRRRPSSSGQEPGPQMRWASCASICPTSTTSTCTTRR